MISELQHVCRSVGLLIVLSMLVVSSDVFAAAQKIPVIHINSVGSETLSPYQSGIMLGKQSKQLFPNIEQRYDIHLAKLFSRAQFNRLSGQALLQLLAQVDKKDKEEMRGVTSAWDIVSSSIPGDGKLSLTEYQLLNLLPDLGFAPNGSGFVAFEAAAGEQTLFGRNLDWESTPELRSLQAIIVYNNGETMQVNIGFAGLLTMFTGFNQAGLSLALFSSGPDTPYSTHTLAAGTLNSTAFDLRKALADYNTADSALRFLRTRHYAFDGNLLVADLKKAAVLEFPQTENGRIRLSNSTLNPPRTWSAKQQIAVIDCHLLASLPDNCRDAQDVVRWQRLNELAVFSPERPATPEAIAAIMLDTKNQGFRIFNKRTLQSLVYVPALDSLSLYSAPIAGQHKASITPASYQGLIHQQSASTSYFSDMNPINLLWPVLLIVSGFLYWLVRHNK